MRIFVLGSLNADLVIESERMPVPGETLAAGDLCIFPGGKGANQAVAAARLGARTAMLGRVGRDAFADFLLASQRDAGVDVSRVTRSERATGVALITVFPTGENSIVLSPGANADLGPEAARDALAGIGRGDFLLCQLETPLNAVAAALETARAAGAATMLDPAPARALPAEILALVDYLTPNQTEAAILLGEPKRLIDDFASAEQAAGDLLGLGPKCVVMKLGAEGALIASGEQTLRAPGFPVEPIDTTAAGDTFNAAFAVRLSEGARLEEAARFANAAAAVSVTRAGAQSSAPSRDEAEAILTG